MSALWFVSVGIAGTLMLVLAAILKWKWWWGALLAVGVALGVAMVFDTSLPLKLGREEWFDRSPFRELILFVLMILGMAARVVSLAIEHQRGHDDVAAKPVMSGWDLVYALLFALPAFGALLSQIAAESLTVANVVLSFQTGFLWQTIFKTGDKK